MGYTHKRENGRHVVVTRYGAYFADTREQATAQASEAERLWRRNEEVSDLYRQALLSEQRARLEAEA